MSPYNYKGKLSFIVKKTFIKIGFKEVRIFKVTTKCFSEKLLFIYLFIYLLIYLFIYLFIDILIPFEKIFPGNI